MKYLITFCKKLEMTLINCETTWPGKCFLIADTLENQVPPFAIVDTKLYVRVVTLSTQDNSKLLQQLKSGWKEQLIGTNINHKRDFFPTAEINDYNLMIDGQNSFDQPAKNHL